MKKQLIIDINSPSRYIDILPLALTSRKWNLIGLTLSWDENPFLTTLDQIQTLIQYQVPVYAGCPGPLSRHLYRKKAQFPEPVQLPDHVHQEHAVSFLINTCCAATNKVVIIALGPVTNIAMALRIAPNIASKISQVIIVDELDKFGYATKNLRLDPESAQILLHYGVDVIFCFCADSVHTTADILNSNTELQAIPIHGQICLDRGPGAGALLRNHVLPPNAWLITQDISVNYHHQF